MTALLSIRGLTIGFRTGRGRLRALRGVDLDLPEGGTLGLVGESGSGKSTVLWAITGLLPGNAEIAAGSIRLRGRELLGLDERARRGLRGREMSVVFQDPMTAQIPVLSYGTQLRDVLHRLPVGGAEKDRRAVEMLARVGIPGPAGRLAQYPHEFSGGMRQRAGIAMALLPEPALVLADEPTTALDVTTEAQISALLGGLQRETGAGLVVVSHDLGLIAGLCERVAVMYAGEVVETGTAREVFRAARHPYTRALLECDPGRIRTGSVGRLPVIPGEVPDLADPPPGCIFADRCPVALETCRSAPPPAVATATGAVARCHLLAEGAAPGWPPPAGRQVLAPPAPRAEAAPLPHGGPPVLAVEGLGVRYPARGRLLSRLDPRGPAMLDALIDVSLEVRAGETLGLVGESGSGKTTLARAVLGLGPSSAGSVRFAGQEIRGLPERRMAALRRDMAMMFQDPVGSLSPRMSVRGLITEPFAIHGAEGRDLDAEAERLAETVRLPRAVLARYPHELSGGQARRVGVARALALNPRLVIADEPTAGLDVSVQGEILNLMADLQAAHGLAYLVITHNLPVVRHVSHRLAILYLGRVVEEGPTEAIFAAPAHPYTDALVRGVPAPDPDRPRPAVAVTGEVPGLANRPEGCDFAARCPRATALCRRAVPEARVLAPGRRVACHHPLGVDPG